MLEFKSVNKVFQRSENRGEGVEDIQALRGIDIKVSENELVSVQGQSGCGKTTLLLTAGGLLTPSSGEVFWEGTSLYELTPDRRSRLRAEKTGFVFQQFHLIPYLTVLENVLIPSAAVPKTDGERKARAKELIEHFKLAPRINHTPGELSTGERQRVALARALLNGPNLILADEPTGNLDEENAEIVLNYLKEFASGGGAVLLVTHDPRVASYASRVLHMEEGRVTNGG